jgi:hypothetical protein
MATDNLEIRPEVLDRLRRLAEQCGCSMEDVLERALDKIEPPKTDGHSILGLFADEPQLADEILEDAYRDREDGRLRISDDG